MATPRLSRVVIKTKVNHPDMIGEGGGHFRFAPVTDRQVAISMNINGPIGSIYNRWPLFSLMIAGLGA